MELDTGVYSLTQLKNRGMLPAQIAKAVAMGYLIRLQRGWFAAPHAHPAVVQARRAGFSIGCVTGCELYGLWTPYQAKVHVLRSPGSHANSVEGMEVHPVTRPCRSAVAPLKDCLGQVLRRHDAETGLIVLESAVERRRITPSDARMLIADAPVRQRDLLRHFSPSAQSGSETRVRLMFQQRRIPVRAQVGIPGVGRVDLLVGKSLIVECDSHSHHSSVQDQTEDRRRDLAAIESGFQTLRLSFHQIWYDWTKTQRSILSSMRDKAYLRPPLRPHL